MKSTRERLIADVSEFCHRTGISRRDFGVRAVGNSSFWSRLNATASDRTNVNLRTIERAEEFIRDYDAALEPPTRTVGQPRRLVPAEQSSAPAAFR